VRSAITASGPTARKPRPWLTPLALPLWLGGAVCEFVLEACRTRPNPRTLTNPIAPTRWEQESLASLRNTIIGVDKQTVAAALGLPRTAAAAHPITTHLDSDLWYYPLCREPRWCMAVTFRHQTAQTVEFFCGVAHKTNT
jgi:hypothetical protein